MYGDFQMASEYGPPKDNSKKKRDVSSQFDHPPADFFGSVDELPRASRTQGESYFNKWRDTRQTKNSSSSRSSSQSQGPARPSVGPNPSTEPQSGRFVVSSLVLIVYNILHSIYTPLHLCHTESMHANPKSRLSPRTGPRIQRAKYVPSSIHSILSRLSIRKFARKSLNHFNFSKSTIFH